MTRSRRQKRCHTSLRLISLRSHRRMEETRHASRLFLVLMIKCSKFCSCISMLKLGVGLLQGSSSPQEGTRTMRYGFVLSLFKWIDSIDVNPIRKIAHSIIFLGILLLLGGIPSLPVQYYQTFVLEQKHGFNKSTLRLFITDIFKGWALAAIIGGPFVAAFLWIIRWAGDGFIPWLMSFLCVFSILGHCALPLPRS